MAVETYSEPSDVSGGAPAPRRVAIEDVESRLEEIIEAAASGIETLVMRDGAPYMRFVPIKRTER